MTRARKNTSGNIKVERAIRFESGDVGFNMIYNGVILYRLTRKTGVDEEGEYFWFAFPTYKGNDGRYWKYFYVKFTEEEQELINEQIEDLLN